MLTQDPLQKSTKLQPPHLTEQFYAPMKEFNTICRHFMHKF